MVHAASECTFKWGQRDDTKKVGCQADARLRAEQYSFLVWTLMYLCAQALAWLAGGKLPRLDVRAGATASV